MWTCGEGGWLCGEPVWGEGVGLLGGERKKESLRQ